MPTLPKHRELEMSLRRDLDLQLWKAGERIPSEHELSRQFGCSYMTARQAVTSLVSDRLLQRIPGKGTFVLAKTEFVDTSRMAVPLVFLVPKLWQRLDPYYFPDILAGFEENLNSCGRTASILDYQTAEHTEQFAEGTAVACIMIGQSEIQLIEKLRDRGCRALAVNRYAGRRNIPFIMPDNEGGTALAVEHLVSLGHQDIGFIGGVPGNLDAADRRKGFRSAMKKNKLSPDREAGEGFREEFGYRAAMQLLCRPDRPTALVCASDLSAIGAIKASQELGLSVPDNLSIIGFGDFSISSYLNPGLTTIYLPRRELGEAAARSLVQLASEQSITDTILPTTLVLRGTTAPL